MRPLATVTRAGERDETVVVRPPADRQHSQRLQRFQAAARVHRGVDVADLDDPLPGTVEPDHRAVVAALDEAATDDLGDDRGHASDGSRSETSASPSR